MTSIITLTTDFGTKDGYVGAMKGRLCALSPDSYVIDITHDIHPQDIVGGAWCIARATPHFPEGSVHIIVVDPGVGSDRSALFVQSNQQWYVGPDNGVLSNVIKRSPDTRVFRAFRESRWWKPHQSFDGLAVFSPIGACLANGIPASDLGEETADWVELPTPSPAVTDFSITGEVIMFDRFGNAITNIQRGDIQALKTSQFIIAAEKQTFALVDFYKEGRDNPIAIINSDGMLELSVYMGSARDQFRLAVGSVVLVTSERRNR